MAKREADDTGKIFQRQLDFFDPDKFNVPVHVVGVGATGSWDVLALAKIGFKEIHVWDFDLIEPRNTSGQIYGLADEGRFKVDALADIVASIADVEVIKHPVKWDGEPLNGVVIMGADSMVVRRQIYEQTRFKPAVMLIADHRIGGQKAQLFAYSPLDSDAVLDYETTLFSDEEAADLPCTSRSIADINFFVAGLTVRNIRRFLVSGPQSLIYEMHYDAEDGIIVTRDVGKAYK